MSCETATGFIVAAGGALACGSCFHTPGYLSGDHYVHTHTCTITPMSAGWLDVLDFEIEPFFDSINVDGVNYDGTTGPQYVYVDTSSTISFYSDYSISYDGAYICLTSDSPPPQPTNSPSQSCDTATHFSITSGACRACGNCFYSPNYLAGSGYDNDAYHNCDIAVLQDGWLDVETFDVESYWDDLTIDGVAYDGTVGPQGVQVTTSSSITFYADYMNNYNEDGFHICMSSTFTGTDYPPPTVSPTMPCGTATGFVINSGGCTACGACFHTPNYSRGTTTITTTRARSRRSDGWLAFWTSRSRRTRRHYRGRQVRRNTAQGVAVTRRRPSRSTRTTRSRTTARTSVEQTPLAHGPALPAPHHAPTAFSVTRAPATLAAIASTRPTGSPGTSTTTIRIARSCPCNPVGSTSRSSTSRTHPQWALSCRTAITTA